MTQTALDNKDDNKPTYKKRLAGYELTGWHNQTTKNGQLIEWTSYSLTRSWKKGDEWQKQVISNINETDLFKLAHLFDKASSDCIDRLELNRKGV